MSDASAILSRMAEGDTSAANELLPLVYDHLRAVAGSFFRGQPGDLTLQPTALVHEAYIKLIRQTNHHWTGRAHFMAVAAKAMRQILQDQARRRSAQKRSGHGERVSLSGVSAKDVTSDIDIVALDEVMGELHERNERHSRLVELRFFGGLSVEESAEVLGIATRTVEKDWAQARAWLSMKLSEKVRESGREL